MADSPILPIVVAGAGAVALYELAYRPWAQRRDLQLAIDAAAAANLRQGMGVEEAAQQAIAGVCVGAASVYKVPPSVSAGICQGVGVLAEKGLKVAGKGAIVAAKAVGKGAKTAAKGARKAVGWLGLGALPYDLAEFDRPRGNPFATHARDRAERPAGRKRRSLTGLSGAPSAPARRARSSSARSGVAFYARHLDR
jgi:hypothetical protein